MGDITATGWVSHREGWRLRVFLAIWAAFSGLTFFIVMQGLDAASRRPGLVAKTVASTILGPMTGAVSRDLQSCCLAFSVSLLPLAMGALGVGVLFQAILPDSPGWMGGLRLVLWALGWIGWFGAGIVSFAHALG